MLGSQNCFVRNGFPQEGCEAYGLVPSSSNRRVAGRLAARPSAVIPLAMPPHDPRILTGYLISYVSDAVSDPTQ
jgi:hypothetical protein